MKEVSFEEFVSDCTMLPVEEFVGIFFSGKVSEAASHFNVSRQTMHNWMNDDEYEVEVVYHEFLGGNATYDYILKKQIKRVGAISSKFPNRVGYVYAISSGGITKVGCSKNPKSRVKNVARNIGFDDYEVFISNPTDCMRTAENTAHMKLHAHKRENTIYVREVFSCDLETAISAIEGSIPDIKSGPRATHKSFAKAFDKLINNHDK